MHAYRNTRYENEYLHMQVEKGHHCERVAGSGTGVHSVCDCILIRNGNVYLVEVKATKEPRLYMRAKVKKQLDRMKAKALEQNVGALLAVKLKHRGWIEEILIKPPESHRTSDCPI